MIDLIDVVFEEVGNKGPYRLATSLTYFIHA